MAIPQTQKNSMVGYSKYTQTGKAKKLQLGDKVVKIEKSKRKRTPDELKTYKQLRATTTPLFAKAVKKKWQFEDQGSFFCKCFTCPAVLLNNGKNRKLHAGHYISMEYAETQFEFDNCRPQCEDCNTWREGKKNIFRGLLIDQIGEERVLELEAIGRRINIQSREALITKISELKKFLKE